MIAGRTLSIETGRVAEQANGAVIVRYGDSMVLVTATMSKEPREGVDFFPLTVDYEERFYAAGKIPGNWQRREGRPSEQAILTARLVDRPIRPLFPKGFRNDVQVIITTLSADQENDPDLLAIIGGSAALTISDIPFEGPVAGVRVGLQDGKFILNPTMQQIIEGELDLTVAGTEQAVVMLEAGAREVPEETVIDAIAFGQQALQEIIQLQLEMQREIGQPKIQFEPYKPPAELVEAIKEKLGDRLTEALNQTDRTVRDEKLTELKQELLEQLGEQYEPKAILSVFDDMESHLVRKQIIENGWRPDGRSATEIRQISCAVGLLPRAHGSGLFKRGQTQVLSVTTLGSVGDAQEIDSIGLEEMKRFTHHYNFPPYSVGEVRPLRGAGRREIGHGALAERALAAVIPDRDQFPYTIRVVSEVLSSNGSTSMGSTCASTLSLLDAGVPLKAPVSGIAMGLMTDDEGHYKVLSDIQGLEDHSGDMDFKVAGTEKGVTAVQLDIKIKGLSQEIIEKTIHQARDGRLYIMSKMLEAIDAPRPTLSQYAPRILRIHINPEKIGALIGPGGKNIRGIQEETKTQIDIEEDGSVFISAVDGAGAQEAIRRIERLTKEVEPGMITLGKVTRITPMGVFVEILPGKEGLVRLGDLAEYRVARAEDVVSVGDDIMVQVIEIDPQGRINLSRRAVLEGAEPGVIAPGATANIPSGPPGGGRPPYNDRRSQGGGDRDRRGPNGGQGGPPRGPGGFRRDSRRGSE